MAGYQGNVHHCQVDACEPFINDVQQFSYSFDIQFQIKYNK